MVTVPPPDRLTVPDGTLAERADAFIGWFLTILERHGKTWLVAVAGGGMASDPDVARSSATLTTLPLIACSRHSDPPSPKKRPSHSTR